MYKLSAFYFARTSSDMPLDLVIPTVFILIVYFMSGLRTDGAKYFFENYFSVILVCLMSSRLLLCMPVSAECWPALCPPVCIDSCQSGSAMCSRARGCGDAR